ncbi:MAG: ABC transporter ATP-binding protein [Deltaproteobacteria bacterium]|nr:ABC transporter ATP-binding protein [Deltaproteobacteria bacterium]
MKHIQPILRVEQVEKTYGGGQHGVAALKDVSLEVEAGGFVALMGPSGCGKSTLLHLIGGMDRPTRGRITCTGVRLDALNESERARFRRQSVGFVFQFFNLLPTLTVLENVALPLMLDGMSTGPARARALGLLERVGLQARGTHFPAELSGGEMQRTAVARALAAQPPLVLADEPTGSLDSANGAQVMQLLVELNRELGVTILLATHAEEAARYATRTIRLRDGVIDYQHGHAAAL